MLDNRFALKGILCTCSGLALFSLAAGCGGASVATVSGTVKFQGKPVPNATLIFMSNLKNAFPGQTDAEGNYTIAGMPYGDYHVFFQVPAANEPKGPGAGRKGSPGMGPPKGTEMPESMKRAYENASKAGGKPAQLPVEYYDYDTTKLTFKVKQSTETYPIDIP